MAELRETQEHLASRQNCDKALHTLAGILTGIGLDGVISEEEVEELRRWLLHNQSLASRHPAVAEALIAVEGVLADARVTTEELEDLRALCERAQRHTEFYDWMTHTLQTLHGVIHGVLADGILNEIEVRKLGEWLDDHADFRQFWPLTEIDTLITKAVADQRLTAEERDEISAFLAGFTRVRREVSGVPPTATVRGICATAPEIVFGGKRFCFTGRTEARTRSQLEEVVRLKGGICQDRVNRELDYLVVGTRGNNCWAYACYGRKIEEAKADPWGRAAVC